MPATNFSHPYMHFSAVPTDDPYGNVDLRFADVGGDKGLRNAVRFFWNAKIISIGSSGTAPSYVAEDDSVIPGFSWDQAPVAVTPTPYKQPAKRVINIAVLEGPGRATGVTQEGSGFADVGDVGTVEASMLRINFSTSLDRYTLSCSMAAANSVADEDGDYDSGWDAVLELPGTTPSSMTRVGALHLPDCFDTSQTAKVFVTSTVRGFSVLPTAGSLTMAVEYWTYP